MLPAESAVPIAIGANAGSPSTALIVSTAMSPAARAAAWANLFFNLGGVLALTPFLRPFTSWALQAGGADNAVAFAHFVFNASMSVGFLLLLPRIAPVLERRFGLGARADNVG
jgi:phosphate:Na+ symporter